MGLAKLSAARSNGIVNHWKNQGIPWNKTNNTYFKTKLPYIVHTEQNAIYNSYFEKIRDSHIYNTTLPCADCAKSIIQVGIKKVYYLNDSLNKIPEFKESFVFTRKLFAQAKVELIFKKRLKKLKRQKFFRSK